MIQHLKTTAALTTTAIITLFWAGSAQAASDYLLKIEGVPGESRVAGADGGALPHVKKEKWIELMSVQSGAEIAPDGSARATGYDVKTIKTAREASSGMATGKRMHKPMPVMSPNVDTETAALLLPAVQKIREATARMTPWAGCTAGQTLDAITIKQVSTGKEGKILDPVLTTCAADSVSFNFTKIEWK